MASVGASQKSLRMITYNALATKTSSPIRELIDSLNSAFGLLFVSFSISDILHEYYEQHGLHTTVRIVCHIDA